MVGYAADRHAAKKAARQGYMPATAPTPQQMLPPRFMRAAATDTATTMKVINDDPFMWLMQLNREDFFAAWDASDASERAEIISWIQMQLSAVLPAAAEVQQVVMYAACCIYQEITARQEAQQAAPAADPAAQQPAQQPTTNP